jgi:uncharacterized DUF497 family protein
MDVKYELLGLSFVWDDRKAVINSRKHDGVTFEEAATVFSTLYFVWWMPVASMKHVMQP